MVKQVVVAAYKCVPSQACHVMELRFILSFTLFRKLADLEEWRLFLEAISISRRKCGDPPDKTRSGRDPSASFLYLPQAMASFSEELVCGYKLSTPFTTFCSPFFKVNSVARLLGLYLVPSKHMDQRLLTFYNILLSFCPPLRSYHNYFLAMSKLEQRF